MHRGDYLRTLWMPRIYLYNRDIAKPLISEIFRINGPGTSMSQYELEEYMLGPYAEEFLGNSGLPHYELTQKTIYAIQKLLFWAGAMHFLENDEHNYWKKRKREIVSGFGDAAELLEALDVHLVKHFSRFMPLVPGALATILQGSDDLEYAEKIIGKVQESAKPPEDSAASEQDGEPEEGG